MIMNKTNTNKGYIYLRWHPAYDDVYKLGKTHNIPERDSLYATGELKRGKFIVVYEIPIEKMSLVERLLQNEYIELNIKYDAGTEFFNIKILTLIEPYLNKLNVKFKKLEQQEINDLMRCNRVRKTLNKINIRNLINVLKSKRNKQINVYKPRDDQHDIIDKSFEHFQNNDKGILVLTCGVGKTLISLWVAQKLKSNTIIIGVPNILLLNQWEKYIWNLFPDINPLTVSSGVDSEIIIQYLKNNEKNGIIITTYSSAHKVYTASNEINFIFDIKILDETHHLTTHNIEKATDKKSYIKMLNISSVKQLGLTATLKQIENLHNDSNVISNDNIDCFGEIIDRKTLLWAIEKGIVCDYDIVTLKTDEEKLEPILDQFNITEDNDKRLFLSAYSSLLSINNNQSHHILIYSNNKENSSKLILYIKMLLEDNYFDIDGLYYSNYHSDMKKKEQVNIIKDFEKSSFGIITCVYCLGEGWDFPLLDGVVFAENMTSNIRIVQSALRAFRKYKNELLKKAKIILPILSRDDWLENNENSDLKKVREVIYQMGLEDETIEHKIKVINIDFKKHKQKEKENEKRIMIDEFGDYDDDLTRKLRLKTINRSNLSTTYEKARKIIAEKNIKNKEDYYELCEKDNRLTKEPEIVFKGKFTNWIEYLSIKREYYDLEMCKRKVDELLSKYPEIKNNKLDLSKVCNDLCGLDNLFPPAGLWVEYYDINDLNNIIIIKNKKKKRSSII